MFHFDFLNYFSFIIKPSPKTKVSKGLNNGKQVILNHKETRMIIKSGKDRHETENGRDAIPFRIGDNNVSVSNCTLEGIVLNLDPVTWTLDSRI